MNDLRKKKLCFWCKEPYDEKHVYPLRPKVKNNQMEWFYEDEEQSDLSNQQANSEPSDDDKSENEGEQEGGRKLQEAHLTSLQRDGSFRLRGLLESQKVITLLDTGATHNFIDARLVERRGI